MTIDSPVFFVYEGDSHDLLVPGKYARSLAHQEF